MQKLKQDEIDISLESLDKWKLEGNVLTKEFGFKGFRTAIEFINLLSLVAEKIDHHPDWSNSYNRVIIHLTTHQANGLTKKDFIFAKEADKFAEQLRR
ncbi:MAG TPA: 4a-hydroxytetrahydrobiopterin dehydratase [Candidatus Saccharimonadia bacterium]|nr:4a-hydroxytetrahydrobiopterin dehydratase [Candidatus Saccharimonadia bacterium]